MNYTEMRNAADPYIEVGDGSITIKGEALVDLDESMDDGDFGNIVRFSLMIALLNREEGHECGVRIGENTLKAADLSDDAVAGRAITE